jgi:protein phosphatase PTC2/3
MSPGRNNPQVIGPHRVLPGRLSVSRTIGDIEAKYENFGGNPNVVIPKPDIYAFDYDANTMDYIFMGCNNQSFLKIFF